MNFLLLFEKKLKFIQIISIIYKLRQKISILYISYADKIYKENNM